MLWKSDGTVETSRFKGTPIPVLNRILLVQLVLVRHETVALPSVIETIETSDIMGEGETCFA